MTYFKGPPGQSGGRENIGKNFLWFPHEVPDGVGCTGWGLTSLNNFTRPWGIEAVPTCLVPGPGVIREVESGPESWDGRRLGQIG